MPLEEDKSFFILFFYIFLFWRDWTHVLADSQSSMKYAFTQISGVISHLWIFTVVTGGTPLYNP